MLAIARCDLIELLKQARLSLGRDADAGVADGDSNRRLLRRRRYQVGLDVDSALVGELDGVGDEVEDNLPEPVAAPSRFKG